MEEAEAELAIAGDPRVVRKLVPFPPQRIMEGDLVKHTGRNIDVIGHFHAAGSPGGMKPSMAKPIIHLC